PATMSRLPVLALVLCAVALPATSALPGATLRAQFFDPGLSRLPSPDEPAALIQPETVAPGLAAPVDEQKVILSEPGWQVWSPTFWDPWEGNVELGLSGTEGNSQTFNVRFGMTAKHKTPTFVQTLQITSIQKSADGVTTANTALADGRLEWPMPESRWNYSIHGLWEYDEFKAFQDRISADTGPGYEFIQTDATTLIGRSGVSVSHEIGGPENAWNPELLFGGELKHKLNPTHSLSAKVEYYPTIIDFTDFRLNSWASWEISLAAAWGLSLKLSIIDRYDSTPEGARPNDLDYSTVVFWTF